ncbi:MAG: VWA domain-containing protein [Deltaproteobacteria bacterium]|nr:VWA domain-containing protein [Deltaproteobacteria bacterium]
MSLAIAPTLPCPDPDPRGLGGLIALAGRKELPLPLREVRVRAEIAGSLARTVVEQRFANTLDRPMEAVHIFPLPPSGAVTEVELCCGELVVRAECREREEAERTFAEARHSGHRAALLTQERADVHTLRVTNLPPGEEVRVRIVAVEQIEAEDGLLRWRFPTVVAPRYMPGRDTGHQGPGASPDTDRVPDASRIAPPLRLEGGTRLDLEVSFASPPARLESSLHALKMEFDGGLRVAPSGAPTSNRDFVLGFAFVPSGGMRAWTDGTHTLAVIEPPAIAPPAMPRDAFFVVDISGSMGGTKMAAAKKALRTALRGLVQGDRFNVIAFDDRVETFAPDLVDYAETSLQKADQWVSRLAARGGTEMLEPLKLALAGNRPPGRLRTVLFVTDGQAGNDQELVAAVANRAQGARLFPLGIDTAVNQALLERLARVGGGACTLCAPSDDIEAVVARIEARFGSPLVDGIKVEGITSRPEPRTLFAGQPISVYLEGSPAQVRASSPGQSWETTPARVTTPIAALFARDRVLSLEDRLVLKPFEEEALRPEIVRTALAAGIASRFTAFVAVETTRTVSGERVEVVQPVELPAEWDSAFLAAPAGAAPMMVACAAPPPSPAPTRGRGMVQAAMDLFRGGPPAPMDSGDDDGIDAMSLHESVAPSFPPAPGRHAAKPKQAPAADPAAALAATQSADGSWGQDLRRTAAALLALVKLGHTRQSGLRKRTVQKAAQWLSRQSDSLAQQVLALLAAAERGEAVDLAPFADLKSAGAEGAALAEGCRL